MPVCAHTCTCVYVCVHVHMCVYVHVYMHVCACVCVCRVVEVIVRDVSWACKALRKENSLTFICPRKEVRGEDRNPQAARCLFWAHSQQIQRSPRLLLSQEVKDQGCTLAGPFLWDKGRHRWGQPAEKQGRGPCLFSTPVPSPGDAGGPTRGQAASTRCGRIRAGLPVG